MFHFLTPTRAEQQLRYCESLMCPPNTSLERHLSELQSSGQAQCTTVWTKGTVAYRCRTCQVNDSRLVIINKHNLHLCVLFFNALLCSAHDKRWLPVQLKVRCPISLVWVNFRILCGGVTQPHEELVRGGYLEWIDWQRTWDEAGISDFDRLISLRVPKVEVHLWWGCNWPDQNLRDSRMESFCFSRSHSCIIVEVFHHGNKSHQFYKKIYRIFCKLNVIPYTVMRISTCDGLLWNCLKRHKWRHTWMDWCTILRRRYMEILCDLKITLGRPY